MNSNTKWGSTRPLTATSAQEQWFARGDFVLRVLLGTGIQGQISNDQGFSFQTLYTIDSTAGDNDVPLNDPIAYDEITGRLHVFYARNIDSGSAAVLCTRHTDNWTAVSPTWSAEVVIDNGVGHGTNRFYRVAAWAFNGNVSVHYTSDDNSVFTTDGLWRNLSSDGGVTWGGSVHVYSGTIAGAYEPNVCGFTDGSVLVSFYNDPTNTNKPGDIYTVISRDGGATWSASPNKITTTGDYGRPRPACHSGVYWIIANKPWNSSPLFQDVWTLTSTDNGNTWAAPVQRATHSGSTNLDHPDVVVRNNFVALAWNDFSTTPSSRMVTISIDGGTTFSTPVSVFTGLAASSNSDAVKMYCTTDELIIRGYDSGVPRTVYAQNPVFALLPQVETSVFDTFPQSNGTLLNTGVYTQTNLGTAALKANGSNGVTRGASGFLRAGSYRNDLGPFTQNVEVWITAQLVSAGGESDLFLWDPVAKSGYDINAENGDFGSGHAIGKYTAGASTNLATDSVASADGELIALQVFANYVVGFRLNSGSFTEIGRVRDTTFRSALRFELEAVGNANPGPTQQNWGGGTLAVPSNTVAPIVSGSVGVGNTLTCSVGTWTGTPGLYTYQWNSSPDGVTWTPISLGVLGLLVISDATKRYRCDVTATNSVGASSIASSNVVAPPSASKGRTGFHSQFVSDFVSNFIGGGETD